MRIQMKAALIVGTLAVAVLAVPSQSKACAFLDRLFGGCWGAGRTTYSVPYAAPAAMTPAYAAPASSCSTCYYTPQTTYRAVYSPVAMTTYRPSLIPYRSYRTVYSPVYTPVTVASPCVTSCDPCAVPTSAGTVVSAAGSGCATCAPTTTYYGTPVTSAPATSTPAANPAPRTFQESRKPVDQLQNQQQNGNQYQQGQQQQPEQQRSLKPVPDENTRYQESGAPDLIAPDTYQPQSWVRQTVYRTPADRVSKNAAPAPTAPVAEVQWRAASR